MTKRVKILIAALVVGLVAGGGVFAWWLWGQQGVPIPVAGADSIRTVNVIVRRDGVDDSFSTEATPELAERLAEVLQPGEMKRLGYGGGNWVITDQYRRIAIWLDGVKEGESFWVYLANVPGQSAVQLWDGEYHEIINADALLTQLCEILEIS